MSAWTDPQSILTTALVIITGAYVGLTYRLFKSAQDSGKKTAELADSTRVLVQVMSDQLSTMKQEHEFAVLRHTTQTDRESQTEINSMFLVWNKLTALRASIAPVMHLTHMRQLAGIAGTPDSDFVELRTISRGIVVNVVPWEEVESIAVFARDLQLFARKTLLYPGIHPPVKSLEYMQVEGVRIVASIDEIIGWIASYIEDHPDSNPQENSSTSNNESETI